MNEVMAQQRTRTFKRYGMVSVGNWEAKALPRVASGVPCRDVVSERDHHLIPVYLRRTLVKGSGSQSIPTIALEKFRKNFSLLGRKQKFLDTP